MEYTYWLMFQDNQWGYEVLKSGKVFIRQTVSPTLEGEGINDQRTAQQMAKLIIEKLKLNKSPIISNDEELELRNGVVIETRIKQLAQLS